MRFAAVFVLGLSLSVCACSRSDQASNPAASDLSAAGADVKAAGAALAKAASDEAPRVREAGAELSQGVKTAAAQAAPEIRKAGAEIKEAAHKAGNELRASAKKTNDAVVGDHDDDGDNR